MIRFKCECGRKIQASDEGAGKWGKCPSCGQRVQIPYVQHQQSDLVTALPKERTSMEPAEHALRGMAGSGTPRTESPSSSDKSEQSAEFTGHRHATNDYAATMPMGIGGWLILPAIGLVLSPIRAAISLFRMGELARYSWLFSPLYLIDLSMIIATVIIAVLFFGKRRIAVPSIIGLMIAGPPVAIVEAILVQRIVGVDNYSAINAIPDIVGSFIAALVWILYFLNSRRVKNTFVN